MGRGGSRNGIRAEAKEAKDFAGEEPEGKPEAEAPRRKRTRLEAITGAPPKGVFE